MSVQQSAENNFRIWLFEFFPQLTPAAGASRERVFSE